MTRGRVSIVGGLSALLTVGAVALAVGVTSPLSAQVEPCDGNCDEGGSAFCTYIGTNKSCHLCWILPIMGEGTWYHTYRCASTLPDGSTYTFYQTEWEGRGCGLC